MSLRQPSGTTPLDRLETVYERTGLTCPHCGHEDDDGRWRAATSGDRVRYTHRCPSCDALSTRTLRLK